MKVFCSLASIENFCTKDDLRMNSLPTEEEFQNYADTLMLDHFLDPFASILDFGSMSEEKKNSGLSVMTDLAGAGKTMEGAAALTKELREFLGQIFQPILGPVANEAGGWLGDIVRIKRRNHIQMLEMTRKKVEEGNLKIKPANLKILNPVVEHSSLENEKEMQELWSNLLLTEITKGDVHPSVPEILKQLSPTEAKILELMYKSFDEIKKTTAIREKPELERIIWKGFLCKDLRAKINFPNHLIDNLIRLNLCKSAKFHQIDNKEAQKIAKDLMNWQGNYSSFISANATQQSLGVYESLKNISHLLAQTIYQPQGEYESITLTDLGFECVKAWSDQSSGTSSQTSAS